LVWRLLLNRHRDFADLLVRFGSGFGNSSNFNTLASPTS
jgi:hypothetical protein